MNMEALNADAHIGTLQKPKADSPNPRPGSSGPRAVLTEEQAIEIYAFGQKMKNHGVDPPKDGKSVALAKQYDVSPKTIRDIWNRRTWTQETRHLWGENEFPMIRRKSISKPRAPDGISISASSSASADHEASMSPFISTSPNPSSPSPPHCSAQPNARQECHEIPMNSYWRVERFAAAGSDASEVFKKCSRVAESAPATTSTAGQCSLQELAILSCSFSASASVLCKVATPFTFSPPAGAVPTNEPKSQAGGPALAAGNSAAAAVDFSATGARGGWMRRGGEGGADFGAAGPADWTRHGGEGGGGGGGAPCAQPSPARRNPPPAVTAAGSARPPRAASALPSPDAVRQQVGREDRPAAPSAGQRTTSTAEAATKAAAEATAAARNDPFHFDWPHW